MKTSKLFGVALGSALCVGLYACGGGDDHTVAPPPPAQPAPPVTLMLSVNDVYLLTKAQSETDDPLKVNGGTGGSITGSDDTSDPMKID